MKRNKILNTLLSVLMLTCLLVGCADSNDTYTQADAQTGISTEGQEEVLVSETVTEEESDVTEECPEGYVYDYQVSMEPIPEDVAALGGTCKGTIHAFPSKIGMALTELEMEKDPVLKAEVEKRIPEIEAALEEEIGGEFVVDGVILENALGWIFFCTEVETGYQFELHYGNNEYYGLKNNISTINNTLSFDDYYNAKENDELYTELHPIIEQVYGDGNFKVYSQKSFNEIDIVIIQYVEDEVDICAEQERVLNLWEQLQTYNNTVYYNVNMVLFPPEYRQVIEEKNNSAFRYDYCRFFKNNICSCVKDSGDIKCCLIYSGRENKENSNNLDILLQQHKVQEYDREVVWEYWIP